MEWWKSLGKRFSFCRERDTDRAEKVESYLNDRAARKLCRVAIFFVFSTNRRVEKYISSYGIYRKCSVTCREKEILDGFRLLRNLWLPWNLTKTEKRNIPPWIFFIFATKQIIISIRIIHKIEASSMNKGNKFIWNYEIVPRKIEMKRHWKNSFFISIYAWNFKIKYRRKSDKREIKKAFSPVYKN